MNIEHLRNEWDAYDLITEDGIKIEVKSASYLQSWKQDKYSTISFSIKAASHLDNLETMVRSEVKRHADVYVFCLLKHKDAFTINPLKLEQWDFFVVPTIQIDNYKRSKTSITLPSLQKITTKVSYLNLKSAILNASNIQKKYSI